MERRTQIERIITGSLVASFDEYWPDARNTITADLFRDPLCKDVIAKILELNRNGIHPDLLSLTEHGRLPAEECCRIADLAIEEAFEQKQFEYRLKCQMQGKLPVDVTFGQYITQLLKYDINEQRQHTASI